MFRLYTKQQKVTLIIRKWAKDKNSNPKYTKDNSYVEKDSSLTGIQMCKIPLLSHQNGQGHKKKKSENIVTLSNPALLKTYNIIIKWHISQTAGKIF